MTIRPWLKTEPVGLFKRKDDFILMLLIRGISMDHPYQYCCFQGRNPNALELIPGHDFTWKNEKNCKALRTEQGMLELSHRKPKLAYWSRATAKGFSTVREKLLCLAPPRHSALYFHPDGRVQVPSY